MKIQVDKDIYIEILVPSYTDSLYALTNKNRKHLRKWLAWLDLVKTKDDTQTFIDTAIHNHNNGLGSTFAILHQGELAGLAGFNQFDYPNKWAAIGYWLGAAYTGNGIISKVVHQLLEYGFIEHNLNKIEIRCAEENAKSRAIPERLGFTYEATLRQCEWLYDHYVDHAVYTMLACEFTSKNENEVHL